MWRKLALVACALAVSQPVLAVCTGDCNSNGEVTVDELIVGVNIALGNAQLNTCPSFEPTAMAR